ncbi:MAG: hypothetical protein HYV97_11550 [Bdellovibrio sp.]|nr:hypothetical protein [Bdellovibrio sp.]
MFHNKSIGVLASPVFLGIMLFSPNLFAAIDYQTRSVVRSYPMGLLISGTTGISKKIWDDANGKNTFMYGYLRPSVQVQTNSMVNTAKMQLDFAPISFSTLYIGTAKTYRYLKKMGSFNCDEVICEGQLERHYVGTKIGLKFRNIFFMNDYRYEKNRIQKKQGLFADEQATLIGRGPYDYLNQNLTVIGHQIQDHWSLGILDQYSSMKYRKNSSNMALLFGEFTREKWRFMLGAGIFKNLQHQYVFSSLIMLTWQGEKGLLLF